MPLEATVYILRCADGSYYTGLTKQPVEARLWEHSEGLYDGFTRKRRPVVLVFTETYDRMLDAIARYHGTSKSAMITGLIRKEFWRIFPNGTETLTPDNGAQVKS